jgi:6-phosphogluconolactonase
MVERVETKIVDSASQLAIEGAQVFCDTAQEAVAARGRFAVAISGGSTPRAMHRLLTAKPYRSDIPWLHVHLFWVDERLVPANDPASNFGTARRDLLDQAPIPPGHIHPMTLTDTPASAALAYQKTLEEFFRETEDDFPVFDLIVLGIGTDGHTASIFPADRRALETRSWVVAVKGGIPNVHRLTLSAPVLNHARNIVFLVAGSDKAEVVKTALTDPAAGLPAGLILPVNGRLRWILDRSAAARLPR